MVNVMGADGQFWNTEETVVYSDDRYILGIRNKTAYLSACGRIYKLSCQPYEPCLYITDENGVMTVVHNAFDPFAVLELFCGGKTVTSASGMEYGAKDFCVMVEYASGKGDISISDAEKVFESRQKEKKQGKSEEIAFEAKLCSPQKTDGIIENDLFYDIYREYPDSVIDYCLINNDTDYCGYSTHKSALASACAKLFYDGKQLEWQYELERAKAKEMDADRLFTAADDGLTYRKAFLYPPYPSGYDAADFERINGALFPRGRDALEIYEWTTDWSEYFDEGREWWGTLCLTVYDKKLDRFTVIMASATD